jgi:hypothetical protein
MQHSTRLALQSRLSTVFTALRAHGQAISLANLASDMGISYRPTWEAGALESIGAVRRISPVLGADSVDAKYEVRPMREWSGDLSRAVEYVG